MKVLCHVGPWCVEQFSEIVIGLGVDSQVLFISGFRSIDETGFPDRFSDCFESDADYPSNIKDLEVIKRCRLLRSMPVDKALRYAEVTRDVVGGILDEAQPDLFLCESVDQYLQDIIFQECAVRSIQRAGLIRTFINGYYRLSIRGEYHKSRDASDSEVQSIKDSLENDSYIPDNLIALKKSLKYTYARIAFQNMARVAWFFFKSKLPKNKYNYHYNVSYKNTLNEYLHFIPARSLGHSYWKSELDGQKKTIFIPLQHFPEATIDYWVDSIELIDYENELKRIIDILSPVFNVLLKEHPGVWGFRKPSFYKRILKEKKVVVAPTEEMSHACVEEADAVLVWTGTIGFEAALRGKPVFSLANPYYQSANSKLIKTLPRDFSVNDIRVNLIKDNDEEMLASDRSAMVKFVLDGAIPGIFRNDGSFERSNEVHVEEARKIGKHLIGEYRSGSLS